MTSSSNTSPGIRRHSRQAGYALILMLVALMGIGGVIITGFTQGVKQEAEHERYLHNQRILKEAKLALLQYAYNYPTNNSGRGPGRLPCPDTDNSGSPNSSFNCISGLAMVGRFPSDEPDLDFYDAKDASGARLWYAVSKNFANTISPVNLDVINSATQGSITLVDQSGGIIYDGAVAGIAAVIIAPGAILKRDENADGTYEYTQLRNTDPQKRDPRNYLDTFDGFDNSVFTNGGNGDADGFILGPVFDSAQSMIVVNDQLIIVTAEEVIAMAEMAVLEAFRDAIKAYLANVGCIGGIGTNEASCLANGGVGWNPVYPWLYNYRDVLNTVQLSDFYPARSPFELDPDLNPGTDDGYLGNYGRIPSTFAEYFTEVDSQLIGSRLSGSLSLIDPGATDTYVLTETYCKDGCPQGTGGPKTFQHDLVDDGPLLEFLTTQILTDVGFVDIDPNVVGDDGRFTATFPADESFTFEVYFWDEDDSPTGVWTACPDGADELSDCSRDSGGNPTPGVANGLKARILHMTVKLDFSGAEDFEFDYTTLPTITWSRASGASHAWITGIYPADAIVSFPGVLSATYKFERHWHVGDSQSILDPDDSTFASGDVNMTGFSLANVNLGMRYYPELPNWAFVNGWHDSIRMAYADTYLPSVATDCDPLMLPPVTDDCLSLPDERGAPSNIASVLVIAGEHDWVDDNADAPVIVGLEDELRDVFDDGNQDNNRTFSTVRGNDKILVIEEL